MTVPQQPVRRTFWVSFRLNDTPPNDKTYSERLAKLNEAIRTTAVETWWKEPTSFILFFSNKTIDQVAAAVKGAIDERIDLALIGMTEVKDARYIGAIKLQSDLLKLMPFAKKS